MMAQTFSYIIPPSLAMVIAPCKKETPSNSKLFRDRKARRRPTSPSPVVDAVSTHLAGRRAQLPASFNLETIRARGHCVNGAHSISLALLDKLWDGWVLRHRRRRLPPTQSPRRQRPRRRVLYHIR